MERWPLACHRLGSQGGWHRSLHVDLEIKIFNYLHTSVYELFCQNLNLIWLANHTNTRRLEIVKDIAVLKIILNHKLLRHVGDALKSIFKISKTLSMAKLIKALGSIKLTGAP